MSDPNETLTSLSEDPWFGSLDIEIRRSLLAGSTRRSLATGEFVFRRGDAPTGFFVVLRGYLKASTLSGTGREAILTVLEPRDWFGEATSVDRLPRTHDVEACSACEVLLVRQPVFDELMRRDDFPRAVASLLARHTRVILAMLEDATLHTVRVRTARRLLRLARGEAAMGPTHRDVVQVTQETLSMMLGISRQTLALELRQWVDEGLIAIGYGRIEIKSLERLTAVAGEN